jgi:hypothetical protein
MLLEELPALIENDMDEEALNIASVKRTPVP